MASILGEVTPPLILMHKCVLMTYLSGAYLLCISQILMLKFYYARAHNRNAHGRLEEL